MCVHQCLHLGPLKLSLSLRLRTPVKYCDDSQVSPLGSRKVYPTDISTPLFCYTIGTSHHVPDGTLLVNFRPLIFLLCSLPHGSHCSWVLPYHFWFLSLLSIPTLLSNFRHVSSSLKWLSQAGSLTTLSLQSIYPLLSCDKKNNTTKHVTLPPRATYSIFEHFRWLESFLCTVNVSCRLNYW